MSNPKKLKLNRETLSVLDSDEVSGGAATLNPSAGSVCLGSGRRCWVTITITNDPDCVLTRIPNPI
jgi:hypothetical protein